MIGLAFALYLAHTLFGVRKGLAMDSVRIEPVADKASGGGIPYKPESKWSAVWWAVFPFELLIGLPIDLYTAFVAQCLWNWFAASALRLPEISFLKMLGLLWMMALLIRYSVKRETKTLVCLVGITSLCVPPERTTELDGLMNSRILDELMMGFAQICQNTLMLALGFGLHLLIS
jgi:hypothetical protein